VSRLLIRPALTSLADICHSRDVAGKCHSSSRGANDENASTLYIIQNRRSALRRRTRRLETGFSERPFAY